MENIKCARCGKERPLSEMKRGDIIYRTRDPITRKAKIAVKKNYYCADSDCHVHDQMAHEG